MFLLHKYCTRVVIFLTLFWKELVGSVSIEEMILSYEVVNLVVNLYCENNCRTTFTAFTIIALYLLSFVFIDFSVPISKFVVRFE